MYQQKPPLDMAHVLGLFLEVGGAIAAIGLSAVLSFMFFTSIAPPDLTWFPYAAMSLTEGGLIVWGGVFMLQRPNSFKKTVALVMAFGCGLASFVVAGSELDVLIHHTDISNDAGLTGTITNVLVVIFALHLIMFLLTIFHYTLSKPGHEFRNPTQPQYIPQRQQTYIEQESTGASQDNFLQQPQGGYTRDQQPISLAQTASAGVNSLIRKAKTSLPRGNKAARVHGQTNETTNENM